MLSQTNTQEWAFLDVSGVQTVRFCWDRCPHNVRHLHPRKGKEGKPTVAYSLIADHNRSIRSVTVGYPGARNDKSICQYDKIIQDIRSKQLYHDETFSLFNALRVPRQHMGLYPIFDGGYHKWRSQRRPNKYASGESSARFSKRLESVRKDAKAYSEY